MPDPTFATADLGLDRITALVTAPFGSGVVATGTVEEDGATVPAIARITAGVLDTDFPGPTGFGPLPGFGRLAGTATALDRSRRRRATCSSPSTPTTRSSPTASCAPTRAASATRPSRAPASTTPACTRPAPLAVQADGRIVVVGDHPPASAREAQGFALARLFGGTAVSNVSVRSSAPLRKGALRLRLTCSSGPGCAGVVRGPQLGVTDYVIRGGGSTKVDVPVLEKARNRAGLRATITNAPSPARKLTIAVSR